MARKLSDEKMTNILCCEPHYEVYIFIMLLGAYILNMPALKDLNEYTSIYYVLSYADLGFKSRLVIGSFIRLFTSYVSGKTVYTIIHISSVVFIGFLAMIMGRTVKNIAKKSGINAGILVVLFLACPVSVQYLFNINNFGRFDLHSIIVTIILLFSIRNERAKWLAPFLCAFAMLLTYNYVLMYMPAVGIVMLYEYIANPKSKARLLILVISSAAVVALFFYFRTLAPVADFESVAAVKEFLAEKTDIQGGEYPMGDFYLPMASIYIRGADEAYSWFVDLLKVYGSFILFSTAPAYAFIASFWVKSIKSARPKAMKILYLLCLSLPLACSPMFLAIDWDRWFPTLFISQFMLILYFVAVNDTAAVNALKSIINFSERHSFLFVMTIIYLASSIFSNNYSVFLSVMLKHTDNYFGGLMDLAKSSMIGG